jgi:tetratricopeptide (TPR) repeat protein
MATDESSPQEALLTGPELRLLDRRAFVGFPPLLIAPGVNVVDFALQIPDVSFPFSFTGGASRYQRRKLQFGFLELEVDAEQVARRVAEVADRLTELEGLKLHFRPGYLEAQARLSAGERAPVTFKLAFDGDGERLALYVYDVRLYGFTTTPASRVPVLVAQAVKELELLPEVELRGASGLSSRVLPALVQLAAVGRGYKMPSLDQARLAGAEVTGKGLRLRFASGGLPPPAAPDEELLLALEGARAFAEAETLLAQGKLAEARDAYLRQGEVTDAHPFAVERLLTLLVADPAAHELALDVAQSLAHRRDRSATALWAEALVRERRGESARAAERWLALCALARRGQEDASAFFAAESAARAARDHAPQMAVRALHEVLGIRPDHLPSLKALARAADQAHDRAGAIRAFRRIAALARDPADAADAHVHLARLCALTEDDVAGARLHCEAALKLSPNHPEALYQLGELCHRAGEHLRAIKALDRLREVAMGRHEVDRIGRAAVLAGRVWEEGLDQPENALLRYREAASLLPGEPEPLFLSARVAERLGKAQEAVSGYVQTVELAGPAPRDERVREVAHAAHHAMARLCKTRLGEPAKAKEHLEAALALDPRDLVALDELLPYFRAAGRTAELADALEKAAAVVEAPARRAALWAEAGELYRGRLSRPDRAEQLLTQAIDADPSHRAALEGLLALAEAHRDGAKLCRCLRGLANLEVDPRLRVRHLRRLSVAARDLAFDLDLAAAALGEVLAIEADDLAALGELCALQRRRADMDGLATALERRARVAEAQGDKRLAAAALRELGAVLEARLGRVAEALVALEKAAGLSPDPAHLFELAELSLRCDRPEHARRALEDLLSHLPKSAAPEKVAEVRAKLGRACELCGDREAAREHYAQAFPLRRTDDELAARLEALHEEAGDTLRLSELWAARAQALAQHERGADAQALFLRSGRALLTLGERGSAILRFTAALEAAPEGALAGEVLEAMAELELERGARREAARLFARRAALLVDDRAAAKLYARAASLVTGEARESDFLDRALEREPRYAPARIRRAQLRSESDPRGALEDLEAALAEDSGAPDAPSDEARLELTRDAARAAARAGKTDVARRLLAVYVAHRPTDLDACRELADLHRLAGAGEALCDLLGELWQRLDASASRLALREHAELCLELGRRGAAQEALRALLGLQPDNLWAAANLLPSLPADAPEDERLALLSLLIGAAEGEHRAALLCTRARLHRPAGRTAQARADLEAALPESDHAAELFAELAALLAAAGDVPAELALWKQAAAHDVSLAVAAAPRIDDLGRAAAAGGDLNLARAGFALLLSLPLPADERAHAARGAADTALAAGDRTAAAEALQLAAAHGPVPRRLDAALLRARLLEEDRHREAAASAFAAALALSPRHPDAASGLLRCLQALGRWDEVAELYAASAAQKSGADAASTWNALGEVYLHRLAREEAALGAFRRAARADEGDVASRRALHALLVQRSERAEAAQVAEELAGLLPPTEVAPLLRALGEAARGAGAADEALRLLRRAHALSPAASAAEVEALADLLYLKGAVAEALPLYERLTAEADFAARPEHAEGLFLRLADLAEQALDEASAARALRQILTHRPSCGPAAERLARLLSSTRPREAVEVLWSYARTLDEPAKALGVLAPLADQARCALADVDLAAAILQRMAELVPDEPAHPRALAALYRDAGRVQELMAQLLVQGDLALAAGDVPGALTALEEEAQLAEASGRADEALRTLQALRELCEDEGDTQRAAGYERRRGELFRDARLDLLAAEAAFARSFELLADLEVARAGEALARRRDDAAATADWVERTVDLLVAPKDRALAFLELARLYDGPLSANAQAEAAAREALALDAGLLEARALLFRALERDGRLAELAAYHEELAAQASDPRERVHLFLEASRIYRERAGRPDEAAAAVLAARGVRPDDPALTERCADLLHEAGRAGDAAEFDALLLEANPFRAGVYERHRAHLEATGERADLAALLLRRADRLSGPDAATAYLEAAACFREAGATEQSLLCEARAFDTDPSHPGAFEAVRARQKDVRRQAELLARRAAAVPDEQVRLLRERADLLLDAGEALLAAEAFDDLLRVAATDTGALEKRAELAFLAGGAEAAQPWDRRLLQTAGEALPVPVRVRTQLRLGHAALGKGALVDAADAFEVVVTLDGDGPRGAEALSLLSEVHGRSGNAHGLFRTTLRLAERAGAAGAADEAEALLRRASDLFDAPADAVEALAPLARLRPADTRVVERAAEGLRALGRLGEVVEVYERGAEAVGGGTAAQWLLQAAKLLESDLGDDARAFELRQRAGAADPENPIALRAVVEGLRRRGDPAALRAGLGRLAAALEDSDERALVLLEEAELAAAAGEGALARARLEEVARRGPSGAGYLQALDALLPLLEAAGEPTALGAVLLQRAAVEAGEGRADLEERAALALWSAGDDVRALAAARAALHSRPTAARLTLVAELSEKLGEDEKAARAWLEAAASSGDEAQRGALRVRALDALERAQLRDEALELLRSLAEAGTLSGADAAARFERLGEPAGALRFGFPAAMAGGRFDEALRLADQGGDAARAEEALWRLCEAGAEAPAGRLSTLLADRGDDPARLKLAHLQGRGFEPLLASADAEVARAAGEALLKSVELRKLIDLVPSTAAPALAELLVSSARAQAKDGDPAALEHCADRLMVRRPALLRELFELHRDGGRPEAAARALQALLPLENNLPARAVLQVELGELFLRGLGLPAEARAAFEVALASDPSQVAAVQHLVALLATQDEPERFVVMVERLGRLLGRSAQDPWREPLAHAYQRLGRLQDAHAALATLPSTPERLAHRAALAEQLGLTGEALQLREQLTSDPVEQEAIALGYARHALVPFAVKLGERLRDQQALSAQARRELAERLSATPDGAAFTLTLWPALLREQPADPDGWTLFAEALTRCGRQDAATLADGFGAALTGSLQAAAGAPMADLGPALPEDEVEAPQGGVEVTAQSMPRLHAALSGPLRALGAPGLRVWLDPRGGVEAWLRSGQELVLGAGALGAFGPVELGWLCALTLALGAESRRLTAGGEGPALSEAAVRAFEAHPASLAACRVLAYLDDSVRGAELATVDVGRVLRSSAAFRAVAQRAVDLV